MNGKYVMGQKKMQRKQWLIGGAGFVAAVIVCLIAVAVLSPDSWRYTTLTGPVGIVTAGAENRGYVGAEFSNEPSRSLYVADVSRANPGDSDRLMIGDRVTSIGGRAVASFDEYQAVMAGSKPGEIIELGVVRDEQRITLRIRLMRLSEMLARPDGGPSAP